MKLRKYTSLALALMLGACLIGCGDEKSDKKDSGNSNIEDSITTVSYVDKFIDTYWINEDAGIGYFFEKDSVHSYVHGELSSSSYVVTDSTITADGSTIEYYFSGDSIHLTIDEITLEFVKSTKKDFEAFCGASSEEDTTTTSDSLSTSTVLKDTYWLSEGNVMAYHFTADTMSMVFFGTEMSTPCTFTDTQIIVEGEGADFVLDGDTLTITSDGEAIKFSKISKSEYEKLITENATTDSSEKPTKDSSDKPSSDSEYIGMTIKDFVASGAEITGYSGFAGKFEFSAYNKAKSEKYTFVLEGDPEEALDSKELGDEYEDVIGDFEIAEIEIIVVDNSVLQKYIGKTVKDFEKAGYDVDGFSKFGTTIILYAYADDEEQCIEVTLEEAASTQYESIEDPFDADMGKELADFKIIEIKYSMSF